MKHRAAALLAAFSVCALFCSSLVQCQDQRPDTLKAIEQEILSRPDTDMEILAKSRQMISDRVRIGEAAKIADLVTYLDSKFSGKRILPLWPSERYLLSYWTRHYSYILDTERLNAVDTADYSRMIVPPRDMLYQDLCEQSLARKATLKEAIAAADLKPSDSEFLLLFFDFLVAANPGPAVRKELNQGADAYLSHFPDSPYTGFVRQNIRFVLRESEWGFGLDLGVSSGLFSGNVKTTFEDHAALVLGFDAARRDLIASADLITYLRIYLGVGSKVRSAFEYEGKWQKGLRLDVIIPELSVGAAVLENSFLQVAPFAGISGILVSPPEEDRTIAGNDVNLDMFSYSFGLNVDWKIAKSSIPVLSESENSYWSVRTRITYTAPFSAPQPMFQGSIVALTMSVGMFGRPVIRDL